MGCCWVKTQALGGGWRDVSAMKNLLLFCRGPEFRLSAYVRKFPVTCNASSTEVRCL